MRSGAPAVHGNSYENTFSAVISSPYLHLLAGLDRRKRIFIRYGEPQAHGNSVVESGFESGTGAAPTARSIFFGHNHSRLRPWMNGCKMLLHGRESIERRSGVRA